MKLVSVIIPAYNQGQYLGEAVQSVLAQTYQEFEVHIVDDGSTDHTREVAHSFHDPRIHYHYQENLGLSGARNTGVRCSQGQYLSFLDSDDCFLPEKLSLLVAAIEEHPELGMAAGQALLIDETGKLLGKTFEKPPPNDHTLLLGNPLHVGSVLLKKEWQAKVGYFDETLRSYEDWDMWLRLARAGCKMGWVDRPVALYRFHRKQMTRLGKQMTQATFAVLDKVYSEPDLPDSWLNIRDKAYSRANIRAAAHAYQAGECQLANEHLIQACSLDPSLIANDGEILSNVFMSWIELPKTEEPLQLLERIYRNLPDEFAAIRRRRRSVLSEAAIQMAFKAYWKEDKPGTRKLILYAFKSRPTSILNRGVLAIFVRSFI